MPKNEEAIRIMEILITQVGETTKTFPGVEIKIKAKDIITIDLKVTHKAIKDRCKGSNLNRNLGT